MAITLSMAIVTLTSLIMTSSATIHWSRGQRNIEKRAISDAQFNGARLTRLDDMATCRGRIFGLDHMNGKLYKGCTALGEHTIYVYDTNAVELIEEIKFTLINESTPFGLSCHAATGRIYLLALTNPKYGSQWAVWNLDLKSTDYRPTLLLLVETPIRMYVSNFQNRLVVMSTYKVVIYNMDGTPLTTVQLPFPASSKYDVVLTKTGNLLISHFDREKAAGDISEVDLSGKIVTSFKAKRPSSDPVLDMPVYMEELDEDNLLVSDWKNANENGGAVFLVKKDLGRRRQLARGKDSGINIPSDMSYDPQSGLLVLPMLFEKSIRVFRVAY